MHLDIILNSPPIFDVILAEILCIVGHFWCISAMKTLLYGIQSKRRIQKQFAKRLLWDRIFLIKACTESKERKKEKTFYCVANLLTFLVAIAELVYFCVQTLRGASTDKWITFLLPFVLFWSISSADHFFLPELAGEERDLDQDRCLDFGFLLIVVFVFCVFMT